MIYILATTAITKYWHFPFYLFAKCISEVLTQHNIDNKIVNRVLNNNVKVITFTPWLMEIIHNNSLKIFFINSESVTSSKRIDKYLLNRSRNIKGIGDYKMLNYVFNKKYINKKTFFIPPLYSPIIEETYKNNVNTTDRTKTIDILFYGNLNIRRRRILDKLKTSLNIKIIITSNYKHLLNCIHKSKIILILHYYELSKSIDMYRLFYLLSNKAFVIHEDICKIETSMRIKYHKIIFSSKSNLKSTCKKYLAMSQDQRDIITNNIYNWYKITHTLQNNFPIDFINCM
tara:strand:- start:1402 stop:2262 length:861 start_codon:yes stop_codon:yes gene_type:complete